MAGTIKLAASQIGWEPGEEREALEILRAAGFAGLEVAPGRVAGPEDPYSRPAEAAVYAAAVREQYGLAVCSMQGIWFGQAGSMFGAERAYLLEYTRQAILFAGAMGAGNVVFGCPRNRVLPKGTSDEAAVPFFSELGDFAARHGTCLALEANPALYGTNFMTTTPEAFAMARRVANSGCRVNLDFGTMVANGEDPAALEGHVKEISHVHISEPQLAGYERREGHRALARVLKGEGYGGYVSLEMRAAPLEVLRDAAAYLAEVFA